jgi:peptide/nickel transport system permease protein
VHAVGLLKGRPWGIAGGVIILVVILMAALAPVVVPYHYNEMSIRERLAPPGGNHLLGTDNLGRDVFSRLLYGSRPYVVIGGSATIIASVLGLALGFLSARLRGRPDAVLRAAVVVPVLFLAVALLLIEVANMPRLWSGLDYLPTFWVHLFPGFALPGFMPHVIAASLLSILGTIWNPSFVVPLISAVLAAMLLPAAFDLARSISLPARIDDILPGRARSNGVVSLISMMMVSFAVATGLAILIISPGDYMGFGIPPPVPSWGNMISGAGRRYLAEAPWISTVPGIALSIGIVGALLLAVATREIWAPRLTQLLAPVLQETVAGASAGAKSGFWPRWTAALIDVLMFALLGYGISAGLRAVGSSLLIFGLCWAAATGYLLLFWLWGGATPGKMIMRLKVVSAIDGADLTLKQVLIRMLGYLLAILTLGIGFVFIAFDRDARGLPDRLAKTVVVKR